MVDDIKTDVRITCNIPIGQLKLSGKELNSQPIFIHSARNGNQGRQFRRGSFP